MSDRPEDKARRVLADLHGASGVEGIFEAAREIGKAMGAQAAALREERRQKRNARARARYAIRKQAGTLPDKRKPPEAESFVPDEQPDGCTCSTSPRPPCCWCENGGDPDA